MVPRDEIKIPLPCRACGKEREGAEFEFGANICKPCTSEYQTRYRQENRERTPKAWLSKKVADLLSREDASEITRALVMSIWNKQVKCCAISGLEMATEHGNPRSATIDKIDKQKGYTPDNVQLVCSCFGALKRACPSDGQVQAILDDYVAPITEAASRVAAFQAKQDLLDEMADPSASMPRVVKMTREEILFTNGEAVVADEGLLCWKRWRKIDGTASSTTTPPPEGEDGWVLVPLPEPPMERGPAWESWQEIQKRPGFVERLRGAPPTLSQEQRASLTAAEERLRAALSGEAENVLENSLEVLRRSYRPVAAPASAQPAIVSRPIVRPVSPRNALGIVERAEGGLEQVVKVPEGVEVVDANIQPPSPKEVEAENSRQAAERQRENRRLLEERDIAEMRRRVEEHDRRAGRPDGYRLVTDPSPLSGDADADEMFFFMTAYCTST